MLAIEDTEYSAFLGELGRSIRPKAIVIFTAHWESETLTISAIDGVYDTIYDFYGFPKELYEVKYPTKGSTALASSLAERFAAAGIPVQKDTKRGLDHGSWTLLHRLYPEADIPVVQVSVNPNLPPAEQYAIGQALRDLGKADILVIGSGVTVHNLRILKWGQTVPEPWAVRFDDWLIDRLQNHDTTALFRYEELAPDARLAVPRAEHFVPLLIAMGSGDPESVPEVIYRNYEAGNLSYLCLKF
jgi:4,5-DOPA dioxygenase extradiol